MKSFDNHFFRDSLSRFVPIFQQATDDELRLFCDKIDVLYTVCLEKNKQLNLTRISEPEDFLIKHVFDSLAGLHFSLSGRIVDWGTGGGFPGLPLACVASVFSLPFRVSLIESIQKKALAVSDMSKSLDLGDYSRIVTDRGENFLAKEKVDFILMRAVAPPRKAVNWLSSSCKTWLFYTSRAGYQEWLLLDKSLKRKGFAIGSPHQYTLPLGLGDRVIVPVTRF